MKHIGLILTVITFSTCQHNQSTDMNFIAQRINKTATITLNAPIDNVFPVFGAFEERKWAEGWNPQLVYPATEVIEEGTIFTTEGHSHAEGKFVWVVSKYNPSNYLIQYLVSTENRIWTITINCIAHESTTQATVTYSFTGLNEAGNELSQKHLDNLFREDLKDWEREINAYLIRG
jgi:hypothetical protein